MIDGVSHALPVETTRRRLRIQGVVQGVGFRPYVHAQATQLGLGGHVGNDSNGVFVEIEGVSTALDLFEANLRANPPPAAYIERVTTTEQPVIGELEFIIVPSQAQPDRRTLVSSDLSICDDCLAELFDPANRRYRYPFINCTNCGPRYTIVRDIPYDRPTTTMADFALCDACTAEYRTPENRRFHAQPNACPTCGPRLSWQWSRATRPDHLAHLQNPSAQSPQHEAALRLAQQVLQAGGIVAIKGIGGFHLACDATNDAAVGRLRARKQRPDKPLAIMAADIDAVRAIAHVNDGELALLNSPPRPIVLLQKRQETFSPLKPADAIALGNATVGVMLPYTPLHHLLFHALEPDVQPPTLLVMTSGNLAAEPIISENRVAVDCLAPIADGFLLHNRPIYLACDDSVVQVVDNRVQPIRRARGYAPLPLTLPHEMTALLAVGGELKNSFCLAKNQHGFLSQHMGDMQNLATLTAFEKTVAHMQHLFDIEPTALVCDLHPGYLSTRWAKEQAADRPLLRVQHHHAHIAAVMADQGHDGTRPVIGYAFDGTGYGPDNTIWGGEVLIADYRRYARVSHLAHTPLPGGEAAIQRPYRAALAALWAAGLPWDEQLPAVSIATETERHVIQRQCETGLATVSTSSMGRLFDVIASLLGVCQQTTYEAQAAIELESLVNPLGDAICPPPYRIACPSAIGEPFDATPLLRALTRDLLAGQSAATIATWVHNAVTQLVLDLSLWLRDETGLNEVALSGGVWQNRTLQARTSQLLERAGFQLLRHHRVPTNDGGLALGQAMIGGMALSPSHDTKSSPLQEKTGKLPWTNGVRH